MGKFNRQNIELLKTYFKSGQFPFFIMSTFLNGTDKTSLQLTRIAARNKMMKKLRREYKKILENDSDKIQLTSRNKMDVIWVCWFQGIESSPEIVKTCFESLKKYSKKKVIVITEKNFKAFTHFPKIIIDKYEEGIISRTHFSDLLRVELLARYGGIWVDSTVLLTDELPEYLYDNDLFFFQNCKPGRDGNDVYISSWLIAAKPNNKIILKTRELLFNYWNKKNYLSDYFLFHEFFCLSCERYEEEYCGVKKCDNSAPHYLQLSWMQKFSEETVQYILQSSSIHKLTYKNIPKTENTVYDVLFNKKKILRYQGESFDGK